MFFPQEAGSSSSRAGRRSRQKQKGGNAWGGEAGGLPVPAWLLFWVPCPTGTVVGADYGKEREPPEEGWKEGEW